MKTALESLDALEALARKIATYYNTGKSGPYDIAEQATDWMRSAYSIVSELPEPIDADVLVARQILADTLTGTDAEFDKERYLDGTNDNWFATRAVITALRRAREEGVK